MQAQVTEQFQAPQSFVSKYDSGERRLDVIELRHVARGLGTTVKAVAAGAGAVPRDLGFEAEANYFALRRRPAGLAGALRASSNASMTFDGTRPRSATSQPLWRPVADGLSLLLSAGQRPTANRGPSRRPAASRAKVTVRT